MTNLKKKDGTIIHIWDNKFHNWEGPAYIPQGNMKKREYYLYGIKYSEIKSNSQMITCLWEYFNTHFHFKF